MLKPFLVRFPNESTYEKVSLDLDFFNLSSEYTDEVFGRYKGTHIFIKKDGAQFQN
jgi:hypothetical protein